MQHSELIKLLSRYHNARILVLGDVMLDQFVYGSVERISPEAPIPVMSISHIEHMLGGAANVARNCASLGAQCTLIGVVGDDDWAGELKSQIDLLQNIQPRLVVDKTRRTTVKTRYSAEGQQILRVDREDTVVPNPWITQRLLSSYESELPKSDLVVLSDYAKGILSETVTRVAIEKARQAGKWVVVDPKNSSFRKYAGANVLTPNRQELQLACGFECRTDDDIVRASCCSLEAEVCDAMVITRGSSGMTIVTRQNPAVHLSSSVREVFDVSGAGDTVAAALSLGLAVGGRLDDAAYLANVAAGIAVGKPGTAAVTVEEISFSLNNFIETEHLPRAFTLQHVAQQTQQWKEKRFKVAFTNGCFDLLHPGHISLLNQAKRTADKLIVGINSNSSVQRLKGSGRPMQDELARAGILSSLKPVDAVFIFHEDTPLESIRILEPDVLVKGADYALEEVVGSDLVIARGGKVVLAKLTDGHSTTSMLQRAVGIAKQ